MSLEKEINQTKPFKSEYQKLVINIQVTSSWLNSRFAQLLKPMDITPTQYNVLKILKGKYPDGYCNQEITSRMIDKSSNSTRIVDKLLKKELITRTENPDDRRLVNIKLNSNGLALLDQIEASLESSNFRTKELSVEKAKLMNEWLDEIRQ